MEDVSEGKREGSRQGAFGGGGTRVPRYAKGGILSSVMGREANVSMDRDFS